MRRTRYLATGVLVPSQKKSLNAWATQKINAGTLALWFDGTETTGTTIYNHGTYGATLNGTWIPGAGGALGAAGLTGLAYDFDGAESVIQVPQDTLFNAKQSTIIWIMKPRSAGEVSQGYLFNPGKGPMAVTLFNSTMNGFRSGTTAATKNALTETTEGATVAWCVLFRTYDDEGDRKIRLYRGDADGLTELPTSTQDASIGALTAVSADAFIFGNNATPVRACDGLLDEFMLLTEVLSTTEMEECLATLPFWGGQNDLYVDDFGAVGDGITDDATAIQAAFDAAALWGGARIHFTSGLTYAIGTAIDGTVSNVRVYGHDATLFMLASTNDPDTLHFYGADIDHLLEGIEVRDLTIDANYLLAGGYQKRGLRFEYCDGPIARNVTVENSFVSLHFSTGVTGGIADNCACVDYNNDGFDAGGTAALTEAEEPNNITFSNCTATSTDESRDHAWEIEDGAYNITLIDCETDGVIGLKSHDVISALTHDITFTRVEASAFTVENEYYDPGVNDIYNVTFNDCVGNISTYGPETGLQLNSTTNPIPTLTGPAAMVVTESFTVTITFNRDVTGFVVGDITTTNATLSEFTAVSASVYTVTVTPDANGLVEVGVAADVCVDGDTISNLAGNALQRTASL